MLLEPLMSICSAIGTTLRSATGRAVESDPAWQQLEAILRGVRLADTEAAGAGIGPRGSDDRTDEVRLIDAIGDLVIWLQVTSDSEVDPDLAVRVTEEVTARLAALDPADRVMVIRRFQDRLREREGDPEAAAERRALPILIDDIEAAAWPFEDPSNTACLTLKRILWQRRPILLVVRAEHDGIFEFLDGDDVVEEDAAVVGLGTIADLDPTVLEVGDLSPGERATRQFVGGPWTR
jgi:hypothetical protein